MVLRNCPSLSIGTERLACLNNLSCVQLGTLAFDTVDPQFESQPPPQGIFSPPSLPSPLGDSLLGYDNMCYLSESKILNDDLIQ